MNRQFSNIAAQSHIVTRNSSWILMEYRHMVYPVMPGGSSVQLLMLLRCRGCRYHKVEGQWLLYHHRKTTRRKWVTAFT